MLSKRIFVLVSLLLVSFLLVSCGTIIPPIGNQAPNITSTAVITATVGVEYTYDVDATDPNGDALTYSLIRNPSGMEIDEDTGVINWTPNSAGSFGVTVKVSDGVLSDTQPFTITITPVAELTEIVVTPDTMALEVGETGTFTVTANYSIGDPQDVTNPCVHTLTQPDAGVITVTAGTVTAVGAGTDTIFISYTEDGVTATANMAVTVSRAKIPMEITVDLPTFTVGGPYWFTVNMIPNDDVGELVVASFGWPISGSEEIAGTLETDVVSDVTFALIGGVFRTDPFAMEDTIVDFRGTFTSPGTYTTTIEVRTSPGDDLLCSLPITIVVEGDPLAVGDSYGGGIVAYTDGTGHGLIVATADQSDGIAWITGGVTDSTLNGNTSTDYGTGQANTNAMMNQDGYTGGAAKVCDDYSITVGSVTYDDWFLPSQDELDKLYTNKVAIGGFAITYWSSSESDATNAYYQDFSDGTQVISPKSTPQRVRAVRTF